MPTIRAARTSGAAAMYDVWYRAEPEPEKPPPWQDARRVGLYEHVVTTGDVLVATEDNRLVGFAALLERSGVFYLSDLFVDAFRQSHGVGRRLLTAILDDRGGVVERAPKLRVPLPGPHPALRLLLEAGFRIVDQEIFMSTDSALVDPQRYVTAGDLL